MNGIGPCFPFVRTGSLSGRLGSMTPRLHVDRSKERNLEVRRRNITRLGGGRDVDQHARRRWSGPARIARNRSRFRARRPRRERSAVARIRVHDCRCRAQLRKLMHSGPFLGRPRNGDPSNQRRAGSPRATASARGRALFSRDVNEPCSPGPARGSPGSENRRHACRDEARPLARSLSDGRDIADELTATGVALSLGGSRYDPKQTRRAGKSVEVRSRHLGSGMQF